MSEEMRSIALPVDDETVQLYLHDASFKAAVDGFVTMVWPVFIKGLKAEAAVRSVEHERNLQTIMQHPSNQGPLLTILQGGGDDAHPRS